MLRLQLLGTLGRDAETKQFGDKTVINFSVANNQKINKRDGVEEITTWVNCSYWNNSRIHEYLKKGTRVYIEGVPSIGTYEKDGQTRVYFELKVTMVQLLGGDAPQSSDSKPASQPKPKTNNFSDEDLPF